MEQAQGNASSTAGPMDARQKLIEEAITKATGEHRVLNAYDYEDVFACCEAVLAAGVDVHRQIQLGPEAFRFTTFQQWVSKAQGWFQTRIPEPARSQHRYVAIDSTGRVCLIGADFIRARDAGTFPVVVYLIDVAHGVAACPPEGGV